MNIDTITDEAVKLVFGILATVLIPIIGVLAKRAYEYLGLKADAETQAKIEAAARAGIAAAEEKARQFANAGVDRLLPADKLNEAVATVLEKVPGITVHEASAVIHEQLPAVRATIAGGLQSVRHAATAGPTS